jgi:FMN-dependent oxidoreductase (nitrilotriacetate monooxygenase family)
MHLFLHPLNTGTHLGGWRHPDAHPGSLYDFAYFRDMALAAERACFDAVFFADEPGYRPIASKDAFGAMDIGKLEPTALLAALAAVTTRIGLIATVSTSFNEPYNIARKFATIDHLSHGRAGWNAVTSTTDEEARNFNLTKLPNHDDRYARAAECVEVVKSLWDSFEDEAFVRDKAAGRYSDPAKLHALGHEGRFFRSHGPLNVGRPPQGQPIIVQAGASEPGRNLGARTADAIFVGYPPLAAAQAYYADMKRRVVGFGRQPDALKIMVSLQVLVAPTEAEARATKAHLDSLTPLPVALAWTQLMLGGVDLSGYPLDGPLPPIPETDSGQTARQTLLDLAARENLTILQLAQHVAATRGGSQSLVGSPTQVADEMERFFTQGAADGFVIAPAYLPAGLDAFLTLVVPILQQRGLFRREYEGPTLRDHLNLPRPANRFLTGEANPVEPTIWQQPK